MDDFKSSNMHDKPAKAGSFLKLLLSNEKRIFSYILTLVPNFADAEEIMQDASIIMWQKFGQFQQDSDFAAWANRIAYHEILHLRRKRSRERILSPEHELLETVARRAALRNDTLDKKAEALKQCLAVLKDRPRQLVDLRFYQNKTVKDIATNLQMSVANVYKTLARVNRQLLFCVKSKLASPGRDR